MVSSKQNCLDKEYIFSKIIKVEIAKIESVNRNCPVRDTSQSKDSYCCACLRKFMLNFHIGPSTKFILEYSAFPVNCILWVQPSDIFEMSRTWQCPVRDSKIFSKSENYP